MPKTPENLTLIDVGPAHLGTPEDVERHRMAAEKERQAPRGLMDITRDITGGPIKLTLKQEYVEEQDPQEALEDQDIGAPFAAALLALGVEISAADFSAAWGEYSFDDLASWLEPDTNPVFNLPHLLPYCDIEAGNPRADELIALVATMPGPRPR